ncbi:MAG: radical SAM protein [Candidatus Thiodiazotropha sp.]
MSLLSNIILLVAQRCNLNCSYCYANGGHYGEAQQRMPEEILQCTLERLLPLAAPRITLSFFGGEPLLNLPLMRRAVILARQHGEEMGKAVRFALTTNGTLLNEAAVEFIREHIHSLAVSLDGEEGVNDEARRFRRGEKSVHAQVMEGLARLRAAGVPFALRATLTPANASRTVKSARHLVAQKPVALRMLPDFGGSDWSATNLSSLVEGFATLHEDALEHVLDGGQPHGAEGLYALLDNRLHGQVRERPCGAGNVMLAVAADGSVYPCDHFVGRSEYCMGRVQDRDFPSPEFTRVQQQLEAKMQASRTACGNCPVHNLCGGECPATLGPDNRPSTGFCYFKREILTDMGERLDRLSQDGTLPAPLCRLVEA